jgi:hypothetical protein
MAAWKPRIVALIQAKGERANRQRLVEEMSITGKGCYRFEGQGERPPRIQTDPALYRNTEAIVAGAPLQRAAPNMIVKIPVRGRRRGNRGYVRGVSINHRELLPPRLAVADAANEAQAPGRERLDIVHGTVCTIMVGRLVDRLKSRPGRHHHNAGTLEWAGVAVFKRPTASSASGLQAAPARGPQPPACRSSSAATS